MKSLSYPRGKHSSLNCFVRIGLSCDCDETCKCNGGDREYCSGCFETFYSRTDEQIEINECPFCNYTYKQEELIVKLWKQRTNQTPAIPYLKSPHWINEGIELIDRVKADIDEEESIKQMKQQRRDNLKFVK